MAYARPVLCRLCGFPAPDGGVPVSQVDREKLSEWCLRVMDTELDQEGLEEAVFCLFCVWQARFLDENCEKATKRSSSIWWTQADKAAYTYFADGIIQPCAVTIPMMKKDLLQKHGLLADTGTQQAKKGRARAEISNCIYCSAQLKSRRALVKHVEEEHQNVQTFKCDRCKLFFLSHQEKKSHLKNFHYILKVKCTYCTKGFHSAYILLCHMKTTHDKQIILCKYNCGAYFEDEKQSKEHIRDVHETEVKAKCIYCEKYYPKGSIHLHVKRLHKSIYIKCDFVANCNTFFHTEEEKEKHILKAHQGNLEKCIYCLKNCACKGLYQHVKKYHKNITIKCSYYCKTFFHTLEERQKHIQEVHEGRDKYRCIYCKKMIPNLIARITTHMSLFHKTDAIKCDYQKKCPNYFLTQEEKQKHILEVHESGEDLIRCKFCLKMVKTRGMFDHIRIRHRSESKGLSVKEDMGECVYCRKQVEKRKLTGHIRKNHKTEVIRCNFSRLCVTYFLTLEDRQKHVTEFHQTKPKKYELDMKCFSCRLEVGSRSAMNTHIRNFHATDVRCSVSGCYTYFDSTCKRDKHYEKEHALQEINKIFQCSYCSFVATSREEKSAHTARVHQDQETVQCPQCLKLFKSEKALQRHYKCVHNRGRKKCHHCKSLVLDKLWHNHLQNTSCENCNLVLSCRGVRSEHIKNCAKTV